MNKRLLAFAVGSVLVLPALSDAREVNLVQNAGFESVDQSSKWPLNYELKGAAFRGYLRKLDRFRHQRHHLSRRCQGRRFGQPVGARHRSGEGSLDPLSLSRSGGRWICRPGRLAEDEDRILTRRTERIISTAPRGRSTAKSRRTGKNLTVNGDYHSGRRRRLAQLRVGGTPAFSRGRCGQESACPTRTARSDAADDMPPFSIDDFSLVQRHAFAHGQSRSGRVAFRPHTAASPSIRASCWRSVDAGITSLLPGEADRRLPSP